MKHAAASAFLSSLLLACVAATAQGPPSQEKPALLDPLPGDAGEAGLWYRYYEGDFQSIVDMAGLKPTTEGTIDSFRFPDGAAEDDFGLEFWGAIDVPADGEYTFYTTSDDGSRLYIGGTLVVMNDYPHGATEKSGTISLKEGRHPIYVAYFEGVVDNVLEVAWEGPGIEKGPVPAKALSQAEKVVSFPDDAVSTEQLEWPDIGASLAVTVDTRDAPELRAMHTEIPRILQDHYPLLVSVLGIEGMPLPKSIVYAVRRSIGAPAYSTGGRIVLEAEWFTKHPGDLGCIVHETSHNVQAYPGSRNTPGWLVEGIADYVRYKAGVDDGWSIPSKYREGTSYKNGYGVTTAFLVYVERHYDDKLVTKLSRALKTAQYTPELWTEYTGKSVDDLWEEYKSRSGEDAAE